jgi:hypothetical protein
MLALRTKDSVTVRAVDATTGGTRYQPYWFDRTFASTRAEAIESTWRFSSSSSARPAPTWRWRSC